MRRSSSRRALPILLLLFPALLLGLLPACGGGSAAPQSAEGDFTVPPPGGTGGGTTTPPPSTAQPPIWNAAAVGLGRTALFGSFPSDLVRHGETLFAIDADAIESDGARILAYDVSGSAPVPSSSFATTTIRDVDLLDSAGNPGNAANPIGFGYFLDDLLIASDSLGFVLVNAGGSDSAPTLSNLVVFDPRTGNLIQTLPLTVPHFSPHAVVDSTGRPYPAAPFTQSGAEALAYVSTSSTSGRLYVAMSNLLFGAPSYGAAKLPGTVQVLEVDTTRSRPVALIPAEPPATRTFETRAYNPVALTALYVPRAGGADPIVRLLVTCAGTTGLDAAFHLTPITPAAVEAYDTAADTYEGSFGLGLVGLAAVRPALGRDGAGHRVGFYPSSVTGEIYLLRLDGLYEVALNPARLAVLRGPLNGIPITTSQAGGPGGNITGVGLSPDGRTLAVSGFGDLFAAPQAPGRLFLLNLPANLVTGSGFGTEFVPGATEFGTTPGRALGNLVIVPGDGSLPDVYVNVSGTLDPNFLGNGDAALGSLQTFGLMR